MQRAEPARVSQAAVALGSDAAPHLIWWATWFKPGIILDSFALRTTDGWVLIDPELPAAPEEAWLRERIDTLPIATVLTSDGHERASMAIRGRWGVPVWGPVVAPSERGVGYEGVPDHL